MPVIFNKEKPAYQISVVRQLLASN